MQLLLELSLQKQWTSYRVNQFNISCLIPLRCVWKSPTNLIFNYMHQYKVHLPQRNTWDHEDNMLDSFFMSGINRDKARRDEEEENILDENLDLDKI